MPTAPLKPCPVPGCPSLVASGRCVQHARPAWQGSRWAKPPGWDKTRRTVLERDGQRCYNCGDPANQVDHIVPLSQGGSNDPSNLSAICTPCQKAKAGREGAAARRRGRA